MAKEKEKKLKNEKNVKKEKNGKKIVNKKDEKSKKTQKVKKESYFKSLRKELKLVKWPSFKEIVKYTIATIILCIILVLFFELLNVILAYVKGLFN